MWNSELGSVGEWGVERPGRNEESGKALEEGGSRFRSGDQEYLSWGQLGDHASGQYLLSAYCVLSHSMAKTWITMSSMSSGVQKGFLEERTSQVTPEILSELEEKQGQEHGEVGPKEAGI